MYLTHAGLSAIQSCLANNARFGVIKRTVLASGATAMRQFLNKHYKQDAKLSVAFLFVSESEAVYKLALDRSVTASVAEWDANERKAVLQMLAYYKLYGTTFENAEQATKTASATETWKRFEDVARNPLAAPEDVVVLGAVIAADFTTAKRAEELAVLKATNPGVAQEIETFLASKAELVWYRKVVEKKHVRLKESEVAWASKNLPDDWKLTTDFISVVPPSP